MKTIAAAALMLALFASMGCKKEEKSNDFSSILVLFGLQQPNPSGASTSGFFVQIPKGLAK